MHLTALPLAALSLVNAAEASAPKPPAAEPQAAIIEFQPFVPLGAQCRGYASPTNVEPARQPRFEREPATPDSGQIIYAVDRRINGCSVLVVKYDNTDVPGLRQRFGEAMRIGPAKKGK